MLNLIQYLHDGFSTGETGEKAASTFLHHVNIGFPVWVRWYATPFVLYANNDAVFICSIADALHLVGTALATLRS